MASNDPAFEQKPADIIALYMDPPQHAVHSTAAVIDRARYWPALKLAEWMIEHPYLFVRELGSELGCIDFAFQFLTARKRG